ncbi:MAG TPA: DUF1223 domain-containing protein [Candidatus Angelobacter sp.]|nr:DUF1223 domain-containing protein [Candidatus Angelobacter sp.]
MKLTGMARFWFAPALLLTAALSVSALIGKGDDAKPQKTVVVELFTSEGCSSCPPADELLGHLRQDLAAKNVQVIPLGFHVDYWDSQGWKDRFSSADFTRRQELYARSLNSKNGPYTPQMVIDGTSDVVGNSSQVEQLITREASQPEVVMVSLSPQGTDHLSVAVKAPPSSKGNVILAITEDNLSTHVGAGENNGHTLHHAAVVREFHQLGQLHDGTFTKDVPVKLKSDWKRADLRAVVFVQENPVGKIDGAASVALAGQAR